MKRRFQIRQEARRWRRFRIRNKRVKDLGRAVRYLTLTRLRGVLLADPDLMPTLNYALREITAPITEDELRSLAGPGGVLWVKAPKLGQ